MYSLSKTWLVQLLVVLFIFSVPFKDTIFETTTILLNVIFLYILLKRRELRFFVFDRALLLSLVLICLSMTSSNILGIGGIPGWEAQIEFFLRFMVLFYALVYFLEKKFFTLRFLIITIIICLGIHVLDGIYQYIFGIDFIKYRQLCPEKGRLTAGLASPNWFSLFLMVYIQVLVFLITFRERLKLNQRSLALVILFLAVGTFDIIYTGSRAAWVGLTVSLVFFACLNRYRVFTKKNTILFSVVLSIGILMCAMDGDVCHRFELLVSRDSSFIRTITWKFVLEKILKRPVFGYGIDSYRILAEGRPDIANAVHSVFLEIQLYLGIVGSLSFAFYFYVIIERLKRLYRESEVFSVYLAVFLGLAVIGLFDHSLLRSKLYLSIWTVFCAVVFAEEGEQVSIQRR